LLIDRVANQSEFYLSDVHVPKVVYEIAPRVGDPADPRDEGDDAADFQSLCIHRPAADQQHTNDLELGAQIHQKVGGYIPKLVEIDPSGASGVDE
jgi:hypothetical protein